MSLYDDLRNKLKPEIFTQVTDALGDDFVYDVVPRSRLNKVIKKRNELEEQLLEARGATHATSLDGDDDDDTDGVQSPVGGNKGKSKSGKSSEKQPSVEELRQQWEAEKNSEIQRLKIQFAGLDALRGAGAVDADLAFTLLDSDKITVGEDGTISGIKEQIDALKEKKAFLFGGTPAAPAGTGKQGGTDKFGAVKSKNDFLGLSTQDQLDFKNKYPDVFKGFLES